MRRTSRIFFFFLPLRRGLGGEGVPLTSKNVLPENETNTAPPFIQEGVHLYHLERPGGHVVRQHYPAHTRRTAICL